MFIVDMLFQPPELPDRRGMIKPGIEDQDLSITYRTHCRKSYKRYDRESVSI